MDDLLFLSITILATLVLSIVVLAASRLFWLAAEIGTIRQIIQGIAGEREIPIALDLKTAHNRYGDPDFLSTATKVLIGSIWFIALVILTLKFLYIPPQ